jgi:outer membrane protein OmpA-like peptidoglycan-associated protein
MPYRTTFLPVLAALLLAACASQPAEGPQAPGRGTHTPATKPTAVAPDVQKSRLDHLQSALADSLRGQDVEITRLADGTLLLRIPDRVAFAADSPKPQPALLPLLDKLADALNREPATQVTVEGHTDSLGREVVNQTLSSRRADQVVAYLASKGVAFSRLAAVGRGESQPVADNATEAGRARNRRLDILIRGS